MPRRASSPSSTDPIAPGARRTTFTMAGVLYGLTTLFLAVGAVNGQNNLLFWAFGLSLGGLLISGLFSGAGMMGLRLRRDPPATARAGEPLAVRYRIENANRLVPLYCVTLAERTSTPKGSVVRDPRGPKPAVAFFPHAPAGADTVVLAPSRPTRRGRLVLEGVTASSSFPFGLMRKSMDFDLPGTIVVLPARLEVRDDLLPKPMRRGHGGAASPTGVGHADEFFGVREYIAGDSPRLIAWRASARGDELVVRQHGTPPPTVVWVVLDVTAEDDELEAERAIALAGSVIERLAARGCSVGLRVDAAGVSRLPATGAWHASRLLASLAGIELARESGAGAGGAATAERGGLGIRREHAAVVVHGRAPEAGERSGAPSWSTHLWSPRLESYLAPGFAVPDVLLPPPAPETRAERRRRWVREFFMVDPVGEEAMGGPGDRIGGDAAAVLGTARAGSGAAA